MTQPISDTLDGLRHSPCRLSSLLGDELLLASSLLPEEDLAMMVFALLLGIPDEI